MVLPGLDSEVEGRSPDMVLHDLANQLYIDSKGKEFRLENHLSLTLVCEYFLLLMP